jgi:ABC-2 type transport system ATP-binding protein
VFAVETSLLTKRYPRQRGLLDILRARESADTLALSDVSITVEEGEIFGLLGPNGSGKTTLLKLLSTILAPTSGTARVFGCDVARDPRRVRAMVGLVTGDERSLYWRLTGRQNLEFFGHLYGIEPTAATRRIDELLDLFDLVAAAGIRVSDYSTGMRQRLAICRGLVSSPRLLFLDEPTRGLDPVAAHSLLTLVKDRASGRFDSTVILTTHIAREVEQLCNRIAMLNKGTKVFDGTVDELRASLQRGQTYLLTLTGWTGEAADALRRRIGAESCRVRSTHEGETLIELTLTDRIQLSDALRPLLFSGIGIRECTRVEASFEEMFRAVFEAQTLERRREAVAGVAQA